MRCDWKGFLSVLPVWLRDQVDKHEKEHLLELRMRIGQPAELVLQRGSIWMQKSITVEDIAFCINAASRYSPWSSATIDKGYITAKGGHRIGICGTAINTNQHMSGMRNPTSLCIRVARDLPGIAEKLKNLKGSILIIGKPGCGKTTLLRDLVRCKSELGPGSIAVVDEKGEVFPSKVENFIFPPGRRTDVIFGCTKSQGIDVVLRNMGPAVIALDEITAQEDCQALQHAGWCGVTLYATAHAHCREDLFSREIYRPLAESGLFETLVVMDSNRSWRLERMNQ